VDNKAELVAVIIIFKQ